MALDATGRKASPFHPESKEAQRDVVMAEGETFRLQFMTIEVRVVLSVDFLPEKAV